MDNPGGRRVIPDPPRRVTVAAAPWVRAVVREPMTWFAALAAAALAASLYLEFFR